MTRVSFVTWACLCLASAELMGASQDQLQLRISWGHTTPEVNPFYLKLAATNAAMSDAIGHGLEPGDRSEHTTWSTQAGGGDVDAVEFALRFPQRQITAITNVQRIWAALIAQSDADTAQRLRDDPAYRPDPRVLTVQMDAEGTRGFSVTIDQLLREKAIWTPSLDVYITAGDPPLAWADHQERLRQWKGNRILDQVQREPEASYEEYTARWEDMGSPAYKTSDEVGPGHIVGITWDSALHKFGIDRGAGVWNDYGNPDRFHTWFDFGDLSKDLSASWKGQRLTDGLPVITTAFENEGVRQEVEQFAYPLDGPPEIRRGDIPMVLFTKVTLTNLSDAPRQTAFKLRHRRLLPEASTVRLAAAQDAAVLEESTAGDVLLSIQGARDDVRANDIEEKKPAKPENPNAAWKTTELVVRLEVPARGTREVLFKLPSPLLNSTLKAKLSKLDYASARTETIRFWSDYLDRGAQFRTPEPAVNELFRANLFHALRLPRRHGGSEPDTRIDLPYSNFAYDQKGTPWPVNQAIYVDYMLYDLRGYHAISAEELAAIYRNNQQANGHVGGYANWGVYTPSMVYSSAKNFLLSGDRTAFDSLLPQTLRALDWCLGEVKKSERPGSSTGLVRAPLNDLTGDGIWAFNQAYFYAAFDLLGKALTQLGHPRAEECKSAAAAFRRSVERGFGAASMLSPLTQLRNRTWIPYVPCEALSPGRLLQQWYPTDVDTGATHLLRLDALNPAGPLADSLLHDHEDNLFLRGWGMANEPVYNQQATAYLYRDDAKAAIRAFYSMMACAFSHSVFEPVEHRWSWGQYFGPPSTDGAWFELYRNMLIRELDDNSLLLLQAAPRKWLADGKGIQVDRAPTYYGKISFKLQSQAAAGSITTEIEMPDRARPGSLRLRLRHPQSLPIRAMTVNGRNWTDFDHDKEWVHIRNPDQRRYTIKADY